MKAYTKIPIDVDKDGVHCGGYWACWNRHRGELCGRGTPKWDSNTGKVKRTPYCLEHAVEVDNDG